MGKKVGVEPLSALSGFFKIEGGTGNREGSLAGGHPSFALPVEDRFGDILAMELCELWLVIEEVDLRRPATLEEVDDTLCLWLESRTRFTDGSLGEKAGERCRAQSVGAFFEEMTAGKGMLVHTG